MEEDSVRHDAENEGEGGGTPTQPSKSTPGGQGDSQDQTDSPDPQKLHSDPHANLDKKSEEKISPRIDSVEEPTSLRRDEMAQIRAACNSCYDIPEAELRAVPAVLLKMLANPDLPSRSKIAAAKTLLEIRKYHLKQIEVLDTIGLLNPQEEAVKLIKMPLPGPGAMLDGEEAAPDA